MRENSIKVGDYVDVSHIETNKRTKQPITMFAEVLEKPSIFNLFMWKLGNMQTGGLVYLRRYNRIEVAENLIKTKHFKTFAEIQKAVKDQVEGK